MNLRNLSEEEIFHEARQQATPEQRANYVKAACGNDHELRSRVMDLLKSAQDKDFLENPPPAISGATIYVLPVSEKPGDKIGRYKLLQQIGEGGWGVVYMAEQEEPVRRRVALKIIKLGMDTKQVVARFEAERQALALMDHPNIAQVHDAGATETGRPFFVMELVRGLKITDYCDQNKLSTEARLKLFMQVCLAVQHAHQKGIIHRDIKPSNILVTLQDGAVPVPKVIDFGIAKATTDQRLTNKTLFTAFEQFIGTPDYMSPEQSGLGGMDIDTRSDIYSLGVLLYEILISKTPFGLQERFKAFSEEMRRIIREEEPQRPSTRLSAFSVADLTTISKQRHSEPPKLLSLIRGDLDWIVMKCLEKDRTRRFETASALALDISRYLSNEPVMARPPSKLYRFQKLVRRNKLAFAGASAVIAALFIGLGLSTWLFLREKEARKYADTETKKSHQVSKFLKAMLNGVGPSVALGRDTTMLREILDRTAESVGKDLKEQPDVEAELRNTIGKVYWALGDYQKAEAMARDALVLQRAFLGHEHPAVATSLDALAVALQSQGKLAEAESLEREALAMRKKLLGRDDLLVAHSLNNLALVLRFRNKFAEAEALHREELAMSRKLLGNQHPDVATSLDNLAIVLWSQGKLVEAESTYREALAVQRKVFGNEHPNLAISLNNLALVLRDNRKLVEAEDMARAAVAMQRRLVGNYHRDLASFLDTLGLILHDGSKLDEAESVEREALAIQRKVLGNEHPDLTFSLHNLAAVLRDEGKLVEAEALTRECLAICENKLPDDWQTYNARSTLGGDLLRKKEFAKAEELLLAGYEGMKKREHTIPADSKPRLKDALQRLVQLYTATAQSDKAAEWKTKIEELNRPGIPAVETKKQ